MSKQPSRTETEILADLYDVIDTLEGPENIAGDGEYPRSKVEATYRALDRRQSRCHAELAKLGKDIDDEEVWAWAETEEGKAAIKAWREMHP